VRVLFTTDCLDYNGAERQMTLTLTSLPARWEVCCFATADGPFGEYLRRQGVLLKVVPRSWRFDPLPYLRLWLRIVRWRPRLVHSWGFTTTVAGVLPCRILRIPLVDSTVRTGDIDLCGDQKLRFGFRWASIAVANSRAGLISGRAALDRARIVRNGFDFARIPVDPPVRSDDRFTVVMAARLRSPKDQRSVIAAVRIVTAELGQSAVRLVLLGRGDDQPRLEADNHDLLDAGILEVRKTSDVIAQLLVSDCGVLMTRAGAALEGCSNAILEYMACQLPTVCSSGGGTDELVVHGETGFLVAPGDVDDLAQRLLWIHANRAAAAQMGREGAEVVRRRYSVATMIAATERVYMEALAPR
jgi:glycosyltransferase involved in cell wall biosynthesis